MQKGGGKVWYGAARFVYSAEQTRQVDLFIFLRCMRWELSLVKHLFSQHGTVVSDFAFVVQMDFENHIYMVFDYTFKSYTTFCFFVASVRSICISVEKHRRTRIGSTTGTCWHIHVFDYGACFFRLLSYVY